jgi:hypothetical protein
MLRYTARIAATMLTFANTSSAEIHGDASAIT